MANVLLHCVSLQMLVSCPVLASSWESHKYEGKCSSTQHIVSGEFFPLGTAAELCSLCIVLVPISSFEWGLDPFQDAPPVHFRPPTVVAVMGHLGIVRPTEGVSKASYRFCQSLMYAQQDNCSLDILLVSL